MFMSSTGANYWESSHLPTLPTLRLEKVGSGKSCCLSAALCIAAHISYIATSRLCQLLGI